MDVEPVSCTLTTKAAAGQLDEWARVRRVAVARTGTEDGVALTFPSSERERVADLAEREAACCRFLDLTIEDHGETFTLSISSANPDAGPVIALLAGT